jgi:arylsulfatase A-like enzyme
MNTYTRRALLQSTSLAAAAKLPAKPATKTVRQSPNVILILADDLGYGDLGCYGQTTLRTPHLDAMAKESLRFTHAYAGSTVCAPSRCCLMTGRHTGHATIRGNEDPHVPLLPYEVTVSEIFKQNGYATGQFGKWGLGTPPDMYALPTRKGFDQFFGYLHQVHAHTYFPDMLWANEREHYYQKNFDGGRIVYSHDVITQKALAFIDDNKARPFFLYAPFTPPHGRFEAPDASPYQNRNWPEPVKYLASLITRLDASVGMILDRLRQHRLDENTLVIFTSDNGPGSLSTKHFKSNGPLRGFKRDLYEGGIRVPFLARWTNVIAPGTTDQVIAFWDFLPTICELLRFDAPRDIDGISYLPTLLNRRPEQQQHDYLYWEFFERGFQQAIRVADWKAIRLKQGDPLELYNLAKDPGEQNNVAPFEPQIIDQMQRRLRHCRTVTSRWG